MFDPQDPRRGKPGQRRMAHPPDRLVINWQRSLARGTAELRVRLAELAEERILARECGLANDLAYIRDLQLEVDGTRAAYAGAVVLQVALFRAELDGRNQG
jgi:hypothetical protein